MGIEGELKLEGRCLVLAASPGSILLIWPTPGTLWDPIAGTVTLDDTTAHIGDQVMLADYIEESQWWTENDWPGLVNKPLAECRGYPVAMIVRHLSLSPE